MKITQIVPYVSADGSFGGPISVAVEQAKALSQMGHEVEFLAGWDGKVNIAIPGVSVKLFPARFVPGFGMSGVYPRGLARYIR